MHQQETQFYFDDVEHESSASGYPHSPDISSPTLSHTPTQYGPFFFSTEYHGETLRSDIGSPTLSPIDYGSSVPPPSGLFHGNPSFVNSLYTSFNSVSHSVPNDNHFQSRGAIMIPQVSIHEDDGDEDRSYYEEVLDTQDSPVPQSFISSVSYLGAGFDTDKNLGPTGWGDSSTAMSRTTSSTSNRSFEDFHEPEPEEFDMELGSPSSFHHEDAYLATGTFDDRLDCFSNVATIGTLDHTTPTPIKITKGRKGRLTEEQRARTAWMRKIGSCACCRKRRAKCDDGIPCMACRRYYRNDPNGLELNPCRGGELGALSEYIMRDNAFPRGGYERFLKDGDYSIEPQPHRILLDLGFGTKFLSVKVQLIRTDPSNPSAFIHKHVEYPWPPVPGSNTRKDARDDLVFPAILADDSAIAHNIEAYLGELIDDRLQFQYFPLWRSDLKVLRHIYKFYLNLPHDARNPLKQALVILMLTHIGGDLRLVRGDPTADHIIDRVFPGMDHRKVTPCFIRSQLGPVFSKLAHHLMKDVLRQLEHLSPMKGASTFPMVISTFAVLFMALESLQYHFEKIAYHTYHDKPDHFHDPQDQEMKLTNEGSDILLRFYKATVCHDQIGALASGLHSASTWPSVSRHVPSRHRNSSIGSYSSQPTDDRTARNFVSSLRQHLFAIRPYLKERAKAEPVVARGDMSVIFDRLLAQMFLLGPPETS